MDARLSSPVPVPSVTPPRIDATPVRAAVATQLAVPLAVSAQAGADQSRFDRRQNGDNPNDPQKSVSSIATDRETGDLVYRVIDPETQYVVTQYPFEALLRLRAYLQKGEQK